VDEKASPIAHPDVCPMLDSGQTLVRQQLAVSEIWGPMTDLVV
jgi:hypothetical protein